MMKNNLLSNSYYQNEPAFLLQKKHKSAIEEQKKINSLFTKTLMKEKINKISSMVENFLKYKQNKSKLETFPNNSLLNLNVSSNNTNDKNLKIIKNGKSKEILGIKDNYFERDEDLYNYYGAIPHFLSFNF